MTSTGIIAIDQGTSSTKGVLLDSMLSVLETVSIPVDLESPQPGWVQQDANQIWESVVSALRQLSETASSSPLIAITNQRESALAWDPVTGEPVSPMLGWQDRRTADELARFDETQLALISAITGLPLDPMFSALKFAHILNLVDPGRELSARGAIALGTVDSWLLFKLTGQHVIEIGNASRTQLLDIETGQWSQELLDLFNVPLGSLPTVVTSNPGTLEVTASRADKLRLPKLAGSKIAAVLADSHAALFAHIVGEGSAVKATYGTGSSIMALASSCNPGAHGLVKTVAWQIAGKPISHALEGNILSSGSTIVWLGTLLGKTPAELAELAASTERSSEHVDLNLVPAFGGLGAPWWDPKAEALLSGMNLATGNPQLARSAFESMVMQIEDVLAAVESATGLQLTQVSVDGGPTSNAWLMQLQADLSQREVLVAPLPELSAFGVAAFAVLQNGLLAQAPTTQAKCYQPDISASQAKSRLNSWHAAIARARRNSLNQTTPSNKRSS